MNSRHRPGGRVELGLVAALSCFALGAPAAHAQAPEPDAKPKPKDAAPAKAEKEAPPPPPQPPRKEAMDYGARPEPTTAGEGALWAPRVLLFPVYLVTEYLVRAPLAAGTTFIERHKIVDTLKDIFVFGPEDNIGVVPTGLIDFGFRPSVGVYFFYDKFLVPDNALRVHVATGGTDYLRGTVTDRFALDKLSYFKLRFEGVYRPDNVYYGTGPRALEANRSRFVETSFEETAGLALEPRAGSGLELYVSLKSANFGADGSYGEDPSLAALVALDRLALPDGFQGYTTLRQGAWASFDTRKQRPEPGTGLRFEANIEHDVDLRDPVNDRWLKYGGAVGGFVDITGKNRVLSLSIATEFTDPLGDAPIPFTELATLGGDAVPMHGFLAGRLVDRSAASATLEYRWPVWSFLDGSAQFAVGNVFGAHLHDFDPDLLRMAFTLGVRSNSSRDHAFNLMIGFGTETFKDGATLNDFRFVFGASRGF